MNIPGKSHGFKSWCPLFSKLLYASKLISQCEEKVVKTEMFVLKSSPFY
jgi:hypothetical protein